MIAEALRVARRILTQLAHDPRFLLLSAAAPVALVLLLSFVLDTLRLPIRFADYAFPAAGFFVFFITYLLAATVLVRERRDGTLARMFASGYGRGAIVLGYITGYATIALLQTLLIVLTTRLAFDVTLGARLLPVAATTMSLSVVSLALGLFVSTLARTEGHVIPTIPLIVIPSLLLSGLVIPHAQLAGWMQRLSYAIPLTWAEKVLLGVMRDGKNLADVAGWLLALIGYGAVLLFLASRTLRETE